ncbi:hypothetical protein Tco_0275133, partial [Tanacetum coccineum]
YLAGEVVSDDEPKPGKGAKPKTPRKPKPQSTSSQPPKPKPAPAKPQEKKRKLLVDEFVDEGVPTDELRFEDEEADIIQKVQGKGKEKVGEEQAAQVLLKLQTPKKKNSTKQFIFQRRTPAPTV